MRLAPYLTTFKNAWQQQLEYRTDTLVRFCIAFISLISIYFLWTTLFTEKETFAGYSKSHLISYYILSGYFFSALYSTLEISEDIRTGSLSAFILRPINYLWNTYWYMLAKSLLRLLLGLPIIILIFFLFRDSAFIPNKILPYCFLLISFIGAINVLFLINVLIESIEFWIQGSSSVRLISDTLIGFFAGTLIPLTLLPGYIQGIGSFLPFQYTNFFLIDGFLGHTSPELIILGIGVQSLWTFFLGACVILVWKKGINIYEAYGG